MCNVLELVQNCWLASLTVALCLRLTCCSWQENCATLSCNVFIAADERFHLGESFSNTERSFTFERISQINLCYSRLMWSVQHLSLQRLSHRNVVAVSPILKLFCILGDSWPLHPRDMLAVAYSNAILYNVNIAVDPKSYAKCFVSSRSTSYSFPFAFWGRRTSANQFAGILYYPWRFVGIYYCRIKFDSVRASGWEKEWWTVDLCHIQRSESGTVRKWQWKKRFEHSMHTFEGLFLDCLTSDTAKLDYWKSLE